MSKNLVIYYSRKGENYFSGSVRSVEKGNTEYVAEFIADAIGADLFEIETAEEYPQDYAKCTDQAKMELTKNVRPKLKRKLDSVAGYDNIFICGPCWWGTYPMAVFSLIEGLDWNGKKVFAVMTHEGSGLGSSVRDLTNACFGAKIAGSIAIQGGEAMVSKKTVSDWAIKCVE
ncbi:MAG: NAD(P)H-dependent oxidoreductase [Candidatus Methanomethylophilaceae archaeon]|nr:NAD(P)H-dependent oxidoreductase [Candidatus Methanomethylophilaceae archaeon]MBP5395050.1 NAD(P)H-dependent oxidoreductase [Candidatus Methanomethylophilaceae archaeon]